MAEEPDESDSRRPRSVWDVPAIAGTILIYAAFLFVLWPLLLYVWIRHGIDERRMRRRLAAEGRLIDWSQAHDRVLAGDGIVVIEMLPPNGYGHAWWIGNQRLAEHPNCPLPEFREPRKRPLYERLFSQPISEWCHEHLTVLMETAWRIEGRMPRTFDEGPPPERIRVVWESWVGRKRQTPAKFKPEPMEPLKGDL